MSEAQPIVSFIKQSPEFYEQGKTIYEALDPSKREIRVLHLEPAADDEEVIKISLEKVSLDDRPVYEPMSYAWGDLSELRSVLVQGIKYLVTVNQYHGLRRLRKRQGTRTMWMDAICINQSDIDERSRQVSIMAEIFRCGSQTRIWLGEPDDTWKGTVTPETISLYLHDMRIAPYPEYEFDQWEVTRPKHFAVDTSRLRSDDWVAAAVYALEVLLSPSHLAELPFHILCRDDVLESWCTALATISNILSRPWWSRIWIVQEVLVSYGSDYTPSIHFGAQQVPFAHVLALIKKYDRHFEHSRCCRPWRKLFEISMAGQQFAKVLCDFATAYVASNSLSWRQAFDFRISVHRKDLMASDPHDYIFGLLGVLNEDGGIPIDYNTPVSRVFAKATWALMSAQKTLDCLRHLEHLGQMHNLPSWAIDFENLPEVEPRGGFRAVRHFGGPEADVDRIAIFDPIEEALYVDCFEADTVITTNEVLNETINSVDTARHECLRWDVWIKQQGISWSEDAYWRFAYGDNEVGNTIEDLINGRGDHRYNVPMTAQSLRYMPTWPDWTWDDDSSENGLAIEPHLVRELDLMQRQRRIFTTANKNVGSGAPNIQPGDKIFVIESVLAAVVLRPVIQEVKTIIERKERKRRSLGKISQSFRGPPTEKVYKLVGSCFISNWQDHIKRPARKRLIKLI